MRWKSLPLVLLAAALVTAASSRETDDTENRLEDSPSSDGAAAAAAAGAATSEGFFGPQLRQFLGALENVDEVLRSTIPSLDRFQCLERVMCSLASSANTLSSQEPAAGNPGLQLPFDPTFQQGIIQDPTVVQQGFPQSVFQQGLPQQPAFQQGFQQQPAFQQSFQQQPVFQQAFAQQPAFQQGFPQQSFAPQFQQPPPSQFTQGSFQQFAPFQGANFRENSEGQTVDRSENRPQGIRRRPLRRKQRNGFLDLLRGLGLNLGKRKKRGIFDDILGGFSGDRLMGLVDQMMTSYSFYPYTHAAYMGYSGNSNQCERLYPSCPSTAEEMINVFNNIHRYYPNGIPFKDSMPWPLNLLLP